MSDVPNFTNACLSGARASLKGANITESCIEGLTIWGFDIPALIAAEQERRKAAE